MTSPSGSTFAARLDALAKADPAAPAWLAPGREPMRRADLATIIATVRRRFSDWGIGPGDVVAWPVIDRAGMAPLLAVVPAVATLVPLAQVLGADTCAGVYARLRVKAVILPYGESHAARDAARNAGIAVIEAMPAHSHFAGAFELALAQPAPSLRQPPSIDPKVMVVTLASGTPGRRKLIPHGWGSVAATAHALGGLLGIREDDVSAHIAPMQLDDGLHTATMLALLNGAAVDVMPEGDVDALADAIQAGRVTYASLPSTMHRELLRRVDRSKAGKRGRLRFLHVSSGRLEPDEADRLEEAFGVPVVTAHSSPEAGTIAQQRLPPAPRKRGWVGGPVACEIRIADEHGNALPPDAIGEVQVRGPQVFDAYVDDPEATASVFVDGWFRLGDLGRLDAAGELEIVGRLEETIDRGGEKLAPSEIDAVMQALPGVAEAAAFGIPHPSLGEEVVAAVVREPGSTLAAGDVIDAVRAKLSDRRAPRRVWFVDALPRTDEGKLRRSALPGLVLHNASATAAANSTLRTSTPLEIALTALWTNALRRSSVGVDENFFMMGGDSLRGATLLMHVRTAFGVDIPVQSLFDEANTIAGMARRIERERETQSAE